MKTFRISTLLLAFCVSFAATGCSLFFNPDNHVGGDGGVDGGVDGATDSGDTDSAIVDSGVVPDTGPPPPSLSVCNSEEPTVVPVEFSGETAEVTVALTQSGAIAHIGYIDGVNALIAEAPFSNLIRLEAWDVTQASIDRGDEAPEAVSFAIRRVANDQLNVVIGGLPAIATTPFTGFYVGTSSGPNLLGGFVLGGDVGSLGEGVPYVSLSGGAPAHEADGRSLWVDQNPDYAFGLRVSSIGRSGDDYAFIDLPRGPKFTVGSSGHLFLVATEDTGPPTSVLWTGLGVPQVMEGETSPVPFHSHIAFVQDDTYLVSRFNAATNRISHDLVDCDFACEDLGCTIGPGGCVVRDGVDETDTPDEVQISTHHVEGLGVAVVTADLIEGATGGPVTEVLLYFLRPDLGGVTDGDGEPLQIVLGEFPGVMPGAIDVDVWVEGDEVEVLVGLNLTPEDGLRELHLIGWDGVLCEP